MRKKSKTQKIIYSRGVEIPDIKWVVNYYKKGPNNLLVLLNEDDDITPTNISITEIFKNQSMYGLDFSEVKYISKQDYDKFNGWN